MEKEQLTNHLTSLILRLPIGILFFFAGLGKLRNLAGFREAIHKSFDQTFLGGPLLEIFIAVLPFVELVVGVLLIVGLLTRVGLMGAAVTLIVLFFGKVVTADRETCVQIAIYLFVTVFALRSVNDNQFSVDALLQRAKQK